MSANAAQLDNALETVYDKLKTLNGDEFSSMTDKLKYLLNSYRTDGNPVGLFEVAPEMIAFLKAQQAKHAKQITDKMIEGLAEAAGIPAETKKAPAKKAAAPKAEDKAAAPKKAAAKTAEDKAAPAAKTAAKKTSTRKNA